MTVLTLGDLSGSYAQKTHINRLKTALARQADEIATGRVSDIRKETGGNLGVLASIEHQLGTIAAFKTAASEASFFASSLQTSLGTIHNSMGDFAPTLLEASESEHVPWIDAASADARARMDTVLSALNVSVAGQSLLAGVAFGTPAMADAETVLTDLMATVGAQTTATGVEAAVDAWFDTPGGGFETVAYLGSTTSRDPFRIGLHETVSLDTTASDQRIRNMLKGYAMAALVDKGALPADTVEQGRLLRLAGEEMITANAGIADLRGEIGAAEASIDTAMTRNETEKAALELARNDIVSADPYKVAVDLQETQTQLEALYAITARLSRLSLTEYLR